MVSNKKGDAPVRINQDANFYITELDKGKEIELLVDEGRQAYIIQIEGDSTINDIEINQRDAAEVVEEKLYIKALEKSHILVIEMKKS